MSLFKTVKILSLKGKKKNKKKTKKIKNGQIKTRQTCETHKLQERKQFMTNRYCESIELQMQNFETKNYKNRKLRKSK